MAHKEKINEDNMIDRFFVGIEWEVQLCLLNCPQKEVYVTSAPRWFTTNALKGLKHWDQLVEIEKSKMYDSCGRVLSSYPKVVLFRPQPHKFDGHPTDVSVDMGNIELASWPVLLEGLSQEIERMESHLQRVVKSIAMQYGPTGAFLPASYKGVYKHFNVSFCNRWKDGKMFLSERNIPSINNLKRKRLHIKMSYGEGDYKSICELVVNMMKYKYNINFINYLHEKSNLMVDPILLGYSMTGDSYITKTHLF